MKKPILPIGAAAILLAAIAVASLRDSQLTAQEEPGRLLRHVVLFKFKPEVTPEQLKEVTDAFARLPDKIPTIKGFEWGTDVSVENLSEGFTHCFLVTFHSAKDRDAYIPHPAHKEFVSMLLPRLEKVLVVDYWTN